MRSPARTAGPRTLRRCSPAWPAGPGWQTRSGSPVPRTHRRPAIPSACARCARCPAGALRPARVRPRRPAASAGSNGARAMPAPPPAHPPGQRRRRSLRRAARARRLRRRRRPGRARAARWRSNPPRPGCATRRCGARVRHAPANTARTAGTAPPRPSPPARFAIAEPAAIARSDRAAGRSWQVHASRKSKFRRRRSTSCCGQCVCPNSATKLRAAMQLRW